MSYDLILASASPRRQEILTIAGFEFRVVVADADEISEGDPKFVVEYNAKMKMEGARKVCPSGIMITADTVVVYDNKILGKPKTPERSYEMLRTLSGTTHVVYTGYTISDGSKVISGVAETKVNMRYLHDDEIYAYINSGSPLEKAGAYGIQDFGGTFIDSIEGDYYNVMGLPLSNTVKILREEFELTPFGV